MRNVLILAFLLDLAGAAAAETLDDESVKLDQAFAILHANSDAAASQRAEIQIWHIWTHHGPPGAIALLEDAAAALNRAEVDVAEQKLIKLVETYPDFAEGWNKRATLYFEQGRYDESLADIAHVLALEPRHFGALSGEGMIYLAQGKKAEALKVLRQALALNPHIAGLPPIVRRLEQLQPDL